MSQEQPSCLDAEVIALKHALSLRTIPWRRVRAPRRSPRRGGRTPEHTAPDSTPSAMHLIAPALEPRHGRTAAPRDAAGT